MKYGFLSWARVTCEDDEWVETRIAQSYKEAWEASGLEKVYHLGYSADRNAVSFVLGDDYITAEGPTLRSLHTALASRKIFALLDYGPRVNEVLTAYINDGLPNRTPVSEIAHSDAIRLSLDYSREVGFYN
jgi:hypothetical protein